MAYQFTQTGQELQNLIDRVYQLADEYDSAINYAVGDYCSHEGKLYKCTAATTGTFDASKWDDSIFVLDEVDSLDTRLTTAESDITLLNTSLAQFSNIVSDSACGLTAQTGVTIAKCYKLKIGCLVTYQMQIVLTSSATATNLITGFETPMGWMNGITGMVRALDNNSTSTDYYLWVSESGVLRSLAVGNANLRFAITYITAD